MMVSLLLVVIFPLIFGTIMFLLPSRVSKIFSLIFQGSYFAYTIYIFTNVRTAGEITESIGGYPQSVGIVLRGDLLSMSMVILASLIFLSILLYDYSSKTNNNTFMFLIIILESLLVGIFLSEDLFNIFVLVELATVIVSTLIMFKKDERSIYDGMIYLFINSVAMMFFLFGLGFIYKIFGSFSISYIRENMHLIKDPRTIYIPYSLIITAVSLKAAIMPLYSWLPKAHATASAPSIVSALLSGLYVNGGIYVYIRLKDAFGAQINTSQYFLYLGLITGIVGFVLAIAQTDIKLILAYSTISQVGLIMIGLNNPHVDSYWGGVYHIVSHSLFKTVLFLTAGIIIGQYKTRDIRKINGVFRRMPIVSTISILAMLGVTGAPMFNGSISKYFIQSALEGSFLEYGIVLINFGTVIYFARYMTMFWGDPKAERQTTPINQILASGILGLACFMGGILGPFFMKILFDIDVKIDFYSYIEKSGVYLLTVVLGWIVYKSFIVKSNKISKIKDFEIGFNSMCLLLALFFVLTLLYLHLSYRVMI